MKHTFVILVGVAFSCLMNAQSTPIPCSTISVSLDSDPNYYAPIRSMKGLIGESGIKFVWEENDSILVKVGDQSSIFTINSGVGTTQATFIGVMPSGCNAFCVQFPVDSPSLSSQEYVFNKVVPKNKMLFLSDSCEWGSTALLRAQYAIVQLNCYGDKTVETVEVNFDNKDYTLNCGKVALNMDLLYSTAFLIIVQPGKSPLAVKVTDTNKKVYSKSTTGNLTIDAGECLNMPSILITDDTADGIKDVIDTQNSTFKIPKSKFIQNGQFLILRKGELFDLYGNKRIIRKDH